MLTAALLAACGEPPVSPPADLLLEVDGLQVRAADLAPLETYVDGVDRRLGRHALTMVLLEEHVLPLLLAQRAFPAERAELRARAAALRDAVDNGGYPALVSKGRLVARRDEPERLARYEVPLNVAAWAFDEANLGQVSPVLEVPQGFCLISTYEIVPGTTRAADLVVAFQVSFYTHGPAEFAAWYQTQKTALRGRVTYVRPDHRDSVPTWLWP